jgi:RIO-like serine/threonine protein kinase
VRSPRIRVFGEFRLPLTTANGSAAIIAAVDDILSVGVVHGDLEWRHIRIKRQNGCNRITIIDFDQAYLLDAKEVAAEEDECRDRLAELFDSDLRC